MSAIGRGLDALGYDEHGAYRPELDTQRDAPGPSRRARADRYTGRVLDVPALLAQPDEPIPWRCHNLAADGFLTVLAGAGGEGKSWLALALACGVARGESAAGIECAKGRALIFDAENGPKLTIRRFRTAGVRDLAVQPVDAGGLLILRDLNWFKQTIEEQRAHLVVFDSLRVLSSGAKENDSDAMEPIVTALKQIARDTGAAVLLVHHRGKSEESDYRGTSAIRDQTDLIFRLQRVKGDPDGRTRRKITTVKCRIEEEPEPRWVQIVADRGRGLVSVDEAEPYEEEHARPRDTHREDVLDALGGIARSERSITKAAGLARTTVQRILADLEAEGLAERTPDGWVAHPGVAHGGGPPGPPPENGSSKPNVGGPLRVGHLGQWATPNGHDPGGETPLKEPTCGNPNHRPADWRMPGARMWVCGECHPAGVNAGVAVWRRNGAAS